MLQLEEAIKKIVPVEEKGMKTAQEKFSSLAMPLGSLGKLEGLICQLCGITHTLTPTISKRAVVVFCGDHGVVAQGVSQVGCEVTTAVAKKLCTGETVMCSMAQFANCAVIPVDVGMKTPVSHPRMLQKSIALGTKDMSIESAMTEKQTRAALEIGIHLALDLNAEGYGLLLTGEMGIGNTTASSALAAALLGVAVKEVTGAGAGLSSEGIAHKVEVIEKTLALHQVNSENPLEVLSKLGGFEIAAMTGLMLGCGVAKIPCVVDGFISNVSALLARKFSPSVLDYLLFSHQSAERGGKLILETLGQSPLLQGDFRLGEGSGAVALLPLLDMGLHLFQEGITFQDMEIPPYQPM